MQFGGTLARRGGLILGVLAVSVLHAATPAITSLGSGHLNDAVATLPAAITTGTTPASFTLFITGNFTPANFQYLTWSDPRSATPTNFSTDDGAVPTTTQVTVPISHDLYSTFATSPVSVSITVTEYVIGLGNVTSNAMVFTLNPPLGPPANGLTLPTGLVGTAYSNPFFSGGTPPYTISLQSGAVPGGLSLPTNPTSSQLISGTPTTAGFFSFGPTITDAWSNSVNLSETMSVAAVPTIVPPLVPGSAVAGSAALQLTVNGTGFTQTITTLSGSIPGSVVQWTVGNSTTQLATTYIGATQLVATIPAALLVAPVTATVTVAQPGTSAVSNGVAFPVFGPSITALSPTSRTAGATAFTLTVSGSNFVLSTQSSSQIKFGTTLLATTVVNAGTLTATVNTPTTPGGVNVQVVNPGGAVSNVATFTVLAAPLLTSLTPASATAGGAAFNLLVNGANFTNTMTVQWNGQALATAFNGPSQLVAVVPGGLIAAQGTAAVRVVTADGVTSGSLPFTINPIPVPPLTIVTASPLASAIVGFNYTGVIAASGGQGDNVFSVTGGALPGGMTLYPGGNLGGYPAEAGTYSFTVQVVDSAGGTASKGFVLVVLPSLSITTPTPLSGTVGTPLSVAFAATGGTGSYTFSVTGSLPPNTQFTAAGVLTAPLAAAATYQFTVTVVDSNRYAATKNFTLVVLAALTITTTSPLAGAPAGSAYSAQFGATGGQQPYTWSAAGLPPQLTFTNSGLLSGSLTTAGAYTLTVTVTDTAGNKASGTFSLAVALVIATKSLPTGTVGTAYSAGLSAIGGTGTLTWTVSGLPAGLTASADGIISGTPQAAGTSTVNVSVVDAKGNTAATSLSLTVKPATLQITTTSIGAGTVGSTYSAAFSATGGVPSYTWSASGVPSGLSFSSAGVLSGTPQAPGTGSLTVTVTDGAGTTASQSFSLTVSLPPVPTLSVTGIGSTANPGTQSTVTVGLGGAYPVNVTVTLTLTFVPDTGGDDPAVQFSTGGRTATIVIPAGATAGPNVGVQTGTVAGTITITFQLTAASQNVTPTPTPSRTIRISPTVPVIVPPITATRTATGFTVVIVGYSSTRELTQATFQFTAASGANLQTTSVTVPAAAIFTPWYQSSASAPFGSQFTYTQPFTVNGSTQSVASVTVTLTNSVGTSLPASANLQ